MQWVKANLTIVISGTVAVLALAMLVWGFMDNSVKAAMEADASLATQIQGLKPANVQMIEDVKRVQVVNEQTLNSMKADLAKIGSHTPLVPDVFPAVAPGRSDAPFEFKNQFRLKQLDLLKQLNAQDAPGPEEFQAEEARMRELEAHQKREEQMGMLDQRGRRPAPGMPGLAPPPGGRGTQPATGGNTPYGFGTRVRAENLTPEQIIKEIPEARVSVRRARNIYCYANLDSLGRFPEITDVASPPNPEQMWYAQVAMWIQEDVVNALRNLNERTAAGLPEDQRWVAYLPVKHLKSIAVGNYVPPAAGGGAPMGAASYASQSGNREGTPPPSVASFAFTGRGSNETLDVVQFGIDLVIDSRYLPMVIDEICKAGFYTPLLVSYKAVEPNPTFIGYIYGSAPSIAVRLDFEGVFPKNKYEKWMPPQVKEAIAQGRAGRSIGAGGGGFGAPPGGGRESMGGAGRFGGGS